MVCGFLLQVLLQGFLAGNVMFCSFLHSFALATIFGRKKHKFLVHLEVL